MKTKFLPISDPMEIIVANALREAGIDFLHEQANEHNLDFYLPAFDVYIEVKRFHSSRISEQMSRAPNVIAVQGIEAVEFLATLLRKRSK